MTRSIGGQLDLQALARLHFNVLPAQKRAAAIRRMSAAGHSPHGIASATGLSVEQIEAILGTSDQRAQTGAMDPNISFHKVAIVTGGTASPLRMDSSSLVLSAPPATVPMLEDESSSS
jgi:hypothetical protein